MDLVSFVLLLLGGCAAGFLSGFFGIGGGIVFVPILLAYYSAAGVTSLVATHLAFGTSLLAIIFTAAASAYQYNKADFVVWRAALIMGLASVAGAAAGALLAGIIAETTLKRFFAVLVFVSALQLFVERRKPRKAGEPSLFPYRLAAAGFAVGVISSLAGVGGGVLTVPLLYSFFHVPLKKSFGTSAAVIVLTAVAASIGYAITGTGEELLPPGTLGYLDPLSALPLVIGSVPLAMVGAKAAERANAPMLRKLFGMFLVALAFKMLIAP